MKKQTWQRFAIIMGLFGVVQFLILTTLAMFYYPGTTIHDKSTEGYTFFMNFFSDLGRTHTFDRTPNLVCHYIFKTALTLTGICLSIFFMILPSLFQKRLGRALAFLAMLLGIVASLCYIGIAFTPYNEYYRAHTFFVRTGFIAFLSSIFFYAVAIFSDRNYPNRYAWVLTVFGVVLALQIVVMLLGPRAWRSPEALFLQAVSQKIIVYGQIFCMLYQAFGAWHVASDSRLK